MSQLKLVICEKPSVAVSISAVLGAKERGDGFFIGGGYIVSWCYGHLVELAAPDAYDEKYAKWRYADLPIIPQEWKYAVPKGKAKQLKTLSELMNRTDVGTIVNACDAGREGQMIFGLANEYCKCTKQVERLWISSMEDAAIRDGFARLKSGADYDSLYASALCRSQADWLVGLNASRLFSTLYSGILSVGRVQSPTLAMLAAREAEIDAFVKEPFYVVELECGGFAASGEKGKDRAAAEAVRNTCDGKPATVTKIERQQKTAAPPKLYDLTALQRDANRLHGFTAQQTLDYAQSLYEKKLLSYPRTDSRYLTSDMGDGLEGFITELASVIPFVSLSAANMSIATEPLLNDAKVSDHHAIIPTRAALGADLAALPSGERDLFYLVAVRLLCAASPKHVYEATAVTIECENHAFVAKGRTVTEDGWKYIDRMFRTSLKEKPDDDEGGDAALPQIDEGQVFDNVTASLREGATSPPKRFTEDTLLAAMENAGAADMPDDAERKGLGTPATRAGIIEKIIKAGYVERQKKSLVPSDKGMNLISILPEALTSPILTAKWEEMLKKVERNEMAGDVFMSGIAEMTAQLVKDNAAPQPGKESLFAGQSARKGDAIGACPRCGSPVREGCIGFFCDSDSCGFKLWRDAKFFVTKKKELTKTEAAALLKDGRVAMTGLFSEKTGKTYDAVVVLDDTGEKYVNFKLEFDQRKQKRKGN